MRSSTPAAPSARSGVEGRLTICNLSIELGAKMGFIAPDETTYAYIEGRQFAPKGALWDRAVEAWRQLPSDADAKFDREVAIDVAAIAPQITWGTSPEHVIAVDQRIPDPGKIADPSRRGGMEAALDYMGLRPGEPIAGTKVDWVFIGSCTNSRLSDLRAAAAVVRGRKVAEGVRAWVVPGSETVKRDAVAEGLDRVFLGGRLRVARARLLHVPRRQRRDRAAGPALGLDLQPQLRRAGRVRARARTSPAPPWPPPRRLPAPSPTCAGWGAEPWTSSRRSIRWPRPSCARTSTPT